MAPWLPKTRFSIAFCDVKMFKRYGSTACSYKPKCTMVTDVEKCTSEVPWCTSAAACQNPATKPTNHSFPHSGSYALRCTKVACLQQKRAFGDRFRLGMT